MFQDHLELWSQFVPAINPLMKTVYESRQNVSAQLKFVKMFQ